MAPVIVISGGPCAGKSTAALAFASTRPTATALIDLDQIRRRMVSGYSNPLIWPPDAEAQRQWLLAVEICGDMARRYHAAGYGCVIDAPGVYPDFELEAWRWSTWANALAGVPVRLVVLTASTESALARNAVREPAERRVPEPALRVIYEMMGGWAGSDMAKIIDTSDLTLEETVSAIEAAVDS